MSPRHLRTDLPPKRSPLVITTAGLSVVAGGCAVATLAAFGASAISASSPGSGTQHPVTVTQLASGTTQSWARLAPGSAQAGPGGSSAGSVSGTGTASADGRSGSAASTVTASGGSPPAAAVAKGTTVSIVRRSPATAGRGTAQAPRTGAPAAPAHRPAGRKPVRTPASHPARAHHPAAHPGTGSGTGSAPVPGSGSGPGTGAGTPAANPGGGTSGGTGGGSVPAPTRPSHHHRTPPAPSAHMPSAHMPSGHARRPAPVQDLLSLLTGLLRP